MSTEQGESMENITTKEYQKLAARTLTDDHLRSYTGQEMMIVIDALGLCGEVGELLDSAPSYRAVEVGDVMWYAAALYTNIGAIMPNPNLNVCGSEMSIALAVSSARFADAAKKMVFHDHGLNLDKLADYLDEFCDDLWGYCRAHGIDPRQAMAGNIDKLKARYPNGFDTQKSINR